MAASENRLMALTYISAYITQDEFQTSAIESEMSKDELIEELAKISVILAGSVAMFMNSENPPTVPNVIEKLRKVASK